MKLTDVCDFQGGSQPPKDEWSFEKQDGYIRMLQIRDFTQSEKVIPEYIKISNSIKICEEDDILIARYGASLGKILTGLAGAYNVAIMRTIPDASKVKKRYLYYYLKSNYFQNAILNVGSRAAQAGFNKEDLAKLEISCPSLSEQEEIINVLYKIEAIIEKRRQEIIKLDEIIKARFVELFGEPRINPFGFEKMMLKDTCKVITGNTPSRAVDDYYGNYVEWIKTDNIVSGILNPTKASESLSEKGMRVGRTVDANAILMACIAGSVTSIGRVCVTNRTVAFNQQINAVVPEKYNVLFLYTLLQISKDYLVEDINMSLKGILSKSRLEEKVFIVPPMELQNDFANFIKQVDKSKFAVQKALEETQILFDSLMQEYFG